MTTTTSLHGDNSLCFELNHRHLRHGQCFSLTVYVFGAIKLALTEIYAHMGINLCKGQLDKSKNLNLCKGQLDSPKHINSQWKTLSMH